ncbi:MAG: squalene/phytoene synthase family protein, partial [Polaromonas sp.]|nr:squalene/phytoene synthase family protein [Polaromonas sp.]
WAGCAAAVEATRLGYQATLFEATRIAGGRARRVGGTLSGEPVVLDNGQHILIGAYAETLRLMKDLGVDADATLLRMPLAATYRIEARHLQAVIDGCQMDLEQNRYLDFPGLKQYCHLVAGIVGEVAARIFGQADEATTAYAHKLGLAFQLTNIIRDVGEDAMRGRIYLPVNELQQFDVKAHEILKRQYSDRFSALMKFQTERALALYDEALAMLPQADRRAQKPGLMMASIYRTLLREIAADGYQVLHQRVSLTPLRKFWLAWKTQAFGRVV